jgi:hypothetical protein
MGVVESQRTLVKSVPELWAQLSEVELLRPMLGPFGEIAITRLVPEASIEWRSELAEGSVELQPSGFGTRVRLTAQLAAATAEQQAPEQPLRLGFWARLRRRPPPAAPPAQTPAPPADGLDPGLAQRALTAVLDEIGTARHRPFSRDAAAAPAIT